MHLHERTDVGERRQEKGAAEVEQFLAASSVVCCGHAIACSVDSN
jgi:hypothetical protein